jgi:hypothetical protein
MLSAFFKSSVKRSSRAFDQSLFFLAVLRFSDANRQRASAFLAMVPAQSLHRIFPSG